jgi:hypothetical protein
MRNVKKTRAYGVGLLVLLRLPLDVNLAVFISAITKIQIN